MKNKFIEMWRRIESIEELICNSVKTYFNKYCLPNQYWVKFNLIFFTYGSDHNLYVTPIRPDAIDVLNENGFINESKSWNPMVLSNYVSSFDLVQFLLNEYGEKKEYFSEDEYIVFTFGGEKDAVYTTYENQEAKYCLEYNGFTNVSDDISKKSKILLKHYISDVSSFEYLVDEAKRQNRNRAVTIIDYEMYQNNITDIILPDTARLLHGSLELLSFDERGEITPSSQRYIGKYIVDELSGNITFLTTFGETYVIPKNVGVSLLENAGYTRF